MSKLKRRVIIVLAVLLCSMLAFATFIGYGNTNAMTVNNSSTNWRYIGLDKNNNGTVSFDELTDLVLDGQIDGDVLDNLYATLGEDDWKGVRDNLANTSANPSLTEYTVGYSSYRIRTNLTSGKDIVLKFGGLKWTVVFISNDRNNEPVLTLWLTDSSELGEKATSSFTKYSTNDSKYTYSNMADPANRYSTSIARSCLNLGTRFSISTGGYNELKANYQSYADHPLAQFTMTQEQLEAQNSGKYSLMQYIDMPYLVPYQSSIGWLETCLDAGYNNENLPNDCYGYPKFDKSRSGKTGATITDRAYVYYDNPSNDTNDYNDDYNSYTLHNYIDSKINGGQNQVTSGNNGWVNNTMQSSQLTAFNLYDGSSWKKTAEWTTDEYEASRMWTDAESWAFDPIWLPALNEPGWKVQSDNPEDSYWKTSMNQRKNGNGTSSTYTSEAYWLRTGGHSANAKDVLTIFANGVGVGSAMQALDTKLSLRPALHLNLAKAEEKATRELTVPTDVTNVTYNGLKQDMSTITNKPDWYTDFSDVYGDTTNIEFSYPTGENDMIDVSTDNGYEVSVTIKKTDKYHWKDWKTNVTDPKATRKFKFKINKMPITINIEDPSDSSAATAEIITEILQRDKDRDPEHNTVPIIEFLYTGTRPEGPVSTTDYSSLLPGTYTATARIKDGTGANYKLKDGENYQRSFTITTLTVDVTPNNIIWRYKNGTGANQNFNAGADGRRAVPYNGKDYTVSIFTGTNSLPDKVKIDTSRGDGGYDNAVKSQAGTYTTKVYLTGVTPDYTPLPDSFTVEWHIDKILYDLTDVVWDYTEPFTYAPLTNYAVSLVIPDALKDEGLSFSFVNGSVHDSISNVGTYTAKIMLSTSNTNYELPVKGDSSTYIYNGSGDFKWELEWEIKKKAVDFQWKTGMQGTQTTNSAGKTFYLPEVIDPENMLDTVKYYSKEDFDTYYDAETGKMRDGATPVLPADMDVAENQQQSATVGNYVAVLEFKSAFESNYKFGNGAYMPFNTFDQRSTLTISMNEDEFKYDCNPHGVFGTDITATGTLQSIIDAYVEYEYFSVADDGTETSLGSDAPTDVGTYKIKIKVKPEGESQLVINGDSEFEFTITPRVLEVPAFTGSLTYDGTERDVAKLVGLPDDWENYLEISIIRQGGDSPAGHTVKNKGTYIVTFTIKSAGNVEWNDASFKTDPKLVTIVVNQLELHAKSWNENGYYTKLVFEESNADKFITFKMYNSNDEEVDMATFYSSIGQTFTVKVSVSEEHGDNVKIVFDDGVTSSYEFTATDDGNPEGGDGNGGDSVGSVAKKKADAKEELEKKAKEKKDEIDADVNLTPEEKKVAKDEIDKELEEGKKAIDKAADADGVGKALEEGKKEIEDTADLAQKKGAAKSELDKAAQAKKDEIDANPELTDEEKAAAKAEVDKELEAGKKAIDGANSIDSVQSAESATKTNIENIKPEHIGGSFPWWILAVIAGALVLLTVIIIVVVKKRNTDDDDGGYDDFYDDEYDYDEEEEIDDGDEAFDF